MTMIEKVARALCEQQIRHARRFDTSPAEMEVLIPSGVDYAWKEYRDTAMVAMRAMIEPSETMLAAGAWHIASEDGEMKHAWNAMIQAALASQEA